ncbi:MULTISPECIES: Imm1 family immunity protein [unclassified Crossiella]|uniref:Imm1 family immunity protein n=1 Tax=unclassified Crossiella TaxID=2620835 RepID=UPI001FFE6678|nr:MULTISPECIES: Imm1 family immunity protein [unclassified Crossiella]MCK2243714.1 Imm1 family immunity protein [Crossiella sp. S99.2]MCK2257573.1 Imm1 family immunity protein [Crossiella sp. S99.1]
MTAEAIVHAHMAPEREPFLIRTAADVDHFFDRAITLIRDRGRGPQLAQLSYMTGVGEDEFPAEEFYVGFDVERNLCALSYLGPQPHGKWFSFQTCDAPTDRAGTFQYAYWGTPSEFPADSGVPVENAKAAVVEFLTTGGARPTAVQWQPKPDPATAGAR